ncbi:GNAT family N-acetyltransferase [Alicyclobacillus fodiniaquatilis]|uniref:GNAT family N-acetyltransferase n=1 Tax=Alicyclobacillus fodiniaquatilis TaxID=1661150 RepID=A0ABW4JFM5_9BACL
MAIVLSELTNEDTPQVAVLIRQHLAMIPPFIIPSHDEIISIIRDPMHYHRLWYPETVPDSYRTPCFVAKTNETVVAAVQLLLPDDTSSPAAMFWMVGLEEYQAHVLEFINEVISLLREENRSLLQSTRNPFAPGWQGIADCWTHLLTPFNQADCKLTSEQWVMYWCNEDKMTASERPYDYTLTTKSQNQRDFELLMSRDSQQVAEADIWFPAPACGSLMEAGVADLEYIKVDGAHRRKGLGGAMLTAAMQEACKRNFRTLILWTEEDNEAMKNLAEKSGFTRGPVLNWLTLDLAN